MLLHGCVQTSVLHCQPGGRYCRIGHLALFLKSDVVIDDRDQSAPALHRSHGSARNVVSEVDMLAMDIDILATVQWIGEGERRISERLAQCLLQRRRISEGLQVTFEIEQKLDHSLVGRLPVQSANEIQHRNQDDDRQVEQRIQGGLQGG